MVTRLLHSRVLWSVAFFHSAALFAPGATWAVSGYGNRPWRKMLSRSAPPTSFTPPVAEEGCA